MTTGNREDYLISILRLTEGVGSAKTTELATRMGVSPPSVSEMLKVLSDDGFVEYEKYKGVKLTEKGLSYARQIRKKHHIMERFLTDVLNVDRDTAHQEACRMEHTMSDDSAIRLCQVVGTHVDDDCQSCGNKCKAVSCDGAPASSMICLSPGERGTISYLKSDDPCAVKKLISMGFVPGREVVMDSRISDRGPRIIEIGNSSVALDVDLAASVFVEVDH